MVVVHAQRPHAARPGRLALRGKATFKSEADCKYGIDIWCGVWEIDGGQAEIDVGDVEFWGNKFKDAVNTKTGARVKAGLSVLKLTGDGVSTIRARKIDFIDAAVLDVSGLRIAPGTYTVIDGMVIGADNLRFASGTDSRKWSLRFDRSQGDILLVFDP